MNLYVSNLGFHVGNQELKDLFSAYGEVTSAKVITDRETNRSRGFGFVEMTNQSEAETAISKLNGSIVEGRAINVNEAKPKPSGPRKQYNNW
ncbi:MAG: RNA recognition motif domain-containing protein [Ilyomonas sp.]|jgi:RNA recognition motif-containing protein